MLKPQFVLPLNRKKKVVIFAGGGGSCTGIEKATGSHVDIAINHDKNAISMHRANHPQAKHYVADCFEVDPVEASEREYVGYIHLSPDCTHHSQARGGQPRNRKIRALAWVAVRWAGVLRKRGLGPDVITLENVEQMLQWSPLIAKRDSATGLVVKVDGSVAAPGERVPVQQQFLVPNPKKKGKNWDHFVGALRALGGVAQWRKLCAADYGKSTATSRERLMMVCRFDGKPIVWPEPIRVKRSKIGTKPPAGKKEWLGACTAIDFTKPCPSIFERKRPLAEATMRRIAKGVKKYVLDSADPFIVRIGQTSTDGGKVHSIHDPLSTVTSKAEHCLVAPALAPLTHHDASDRTRDVRDPMPTITGANRGELALMAPTLIQFRHAKDGKDLREPLPTITAGGSAGGRPAGAAHAMGIASAYLAQMNGGWYQGAGRDLREPMSTITASERGAQQMLVAAHLAHLRGNCDARDPREPLMTISAGGQHHGVVECTLSPEHEAGALRVAAFLMRYYGEGGQWSDLRDSMPTITTKERLALVTVVIQGTPYVIVDVGLRMLDPDELFRASGFPPGYIFTHGHDGRKFTKSQQVKFCGNAVPPELQEAITRVNYSDEVDVRELEAA